MRFPYRSTALLAVALVALVALVAAAPAHAALSWGGQVFGGFNTHAMSDWNDAIDEANAMGANFDNINSGFSLGVGPYVMINNQWMLGADYERLMPTKAEDSGTELDTSANAFLFTVGYMFPSTSMMHFGLGAGVGFYSQSGKLTDTGSPDEEFSGNGVGFHVMGMGEYDFSPMVAGGLSVGYRQADIDLEEVNGQDVSSAGISADYSGLAVKVALKFHQPSGQ